VDVDAGAGAGAGAAAAAVGGGTLTKTTCLCGTGVIRSLKSLEPFVAVRAAAYDTPPPATALEAPLETAAGMGPVAGAKPGVPLPPPVWATTCCCCLLPALALVLVAEPAPTPARPARICAIVSGALAAGVEADADADADAGSAGGGNDSGTGAKDACSPLALLPLAAAVVAKRLDFSEFFATGPTAAAAAEPAPALKPAPRPVAGTREKLPRAAAPEACRAARIGE
jgi:hypothetical protein